MINSGKKKFNVKIVKKNPKKKENKERKNMI